MRETETETEIKIDRDRKRVCVCVCERVSVRVCDLEELGARRGAEHEHCRLEHLLPPLDRVGREEQLGAPPLSRKNLSSSRPSRGSRQALSYRRA